MKTILAPVDFSTSTSDVLTEAIALASGLAARVVLLHAVQPPAIVTEYPPLMQDVAAVIAQAERNADAELAKLAGRLHPAAIPAETLKRCGNPVEHIIAEAARLSASYIVMGSHGHTSLYNLLVGSTTSGVMKQASCPVVIVPPGTKARGKRQVQEATAS